MVTIIKNSTLIFTVKNETGNIDYLLNSIRLQTKLPEKIIIVDAFSRDGTYKKLNEFKNSLIKDLKVKVVVYQVKGNRSNGRNYAIEKTNTDIISATDSGCILKKDWFENIVSGFDKKTHVVAGFYKPVTKNVFEKCLAAYTCVTPDKLSNDFLPSSRSIAFRKSAWEKVGGYPENLDTCEDLVFARNLKKSGFKFKVQKNAIAYWKQRNNLLEAFKQFFSYAKGDGQALYFRKSTPFLFGRYLIGFSLLFYALLEKNIFIFYSLVVLFCFYLIWSIFKNYKYVNDKKAFFWLPVLQITSDIAVFFGTSYGYILNFVKIIKS